MIKTKAPPISRTFYIDLSFSVIFEHKDGEYVAYLIVLLGSFKVFPITEKLMKNKFS